MIKELKEQIEYLGIPAWHDAGYKGKTKQGIQVVSFLDDINDPNHYGYSLGIGDVVSPEGKHLSGGITFYEEHNVITHADVYCRETKETLPFDDFIIKNKVRLINNSKDGGGHDANSAKARYLNQKKKEHNLILTCSAGNTYGDPIDNSYYGAAIVVTGVNWKNGKPYAAAVVRDPDIKFAMPMGNNSGTSFAAPFLMYAAELLLSRDYEMTQEDVIEHFSKNIVDLGPVGPDNTFGLGVPLMGKSTTIIELTQNSKIMMVNGKPQELDQPMIIIPGTNRMVGPMRAPFEAFGAKVDWNDDTNTVRIEL